MFKVLLKCFNRKQKKDVRKILSLMNFPEFSLYIIVKWKLIVQTVYEKFDMSQLSNFKQNAFCFCLFDLCFVHSRAVRF